MTRERWARIKAILNDALERSKDDRGVFLEEACGGDASLREEVELLLSQDDAGSLASPATQLVKPTTARELDPGETLAHYRIVEKVGAGGMGAVYRAHDCKLGRDVALKVLPELLAGDTDAIARFRREAQVLASLNHPHIATIYGLEENAIVMEFVEGPTLAQGIAKGAIPVDEALAIARQLAEALECAHEKGVVHRDLKPANVKVTTEGVVKVLDFGLAKLVQVEGQDADSGTLTPPGMPTGAILGTPAYMAPEQAKGEAVDWRADIWAFGVVLYEMLTGRRLFEGSAVSDTLAAVLTKDPDWSQLPQNTPAWVKRILRRCLERDKRKRLRHLGDAWVLPDAADEEPAGKPTRARLPWIAAAVSGFIAAAALWFPWQRPQAPAQGPVLHFDVDVPEPPIGLAVSPDGMRVVFRIRGGGPLLMRRLDQDRIVPLAGSEGGWEPFFSPDGKWLGFFAGTKLRKMRLEDGVPVTLCDAPSGRGATWGDDGYIVAALNVTGGLSRVHANGGRPEPVTGLHGEVEDGTSHRWPQALPHGKGVVFTSMGGQQTSVEVLQPGSTRPKVLLKSARNGRYLESGHLLYYSQGSIIAVPMDPDRLETSGPGVALVSSVARIFGRAVFDLSQAGTLVYVRGSPESKRVVSWLDSSGGIEPLLSTPDRYLTPRLAPDGTRLAVTIEKGDGANVWVYDMSRDTMTPMPAAAEYQFNAIWTPDGGYLVFQSGGKLAWTQSDGSGRVEHVAGTRQAFPNSFSSDGGRLFFHQTTGGKYDLWDVTMHKSGPRFGQPRRLTEDPGIEGSSPAVSPSGKWLAYNTPVETNRVEVAVAALTRDGAIGNRRWHVSNRSGIEPIWAKNGRELFYRAVGGEIMAVSYSEKNSVFLPAKPRVWSEKRMFTGTEQVAWDVASDGRRVVALWGAGDNAAKPETNLRVVMNFGTEVRKRAPGARPLLGALFERAVRGSN